MRRFGLTLGALVAAVSIVASAYAQSQADKTGSGVTTAVAGQEGGSLLTHPVTLGAAVAAAIGIAVATASAESSAILTSTTTATTTTTR